MEDYNKLLLEAIKEAEDYYYSGKGDYDNHKLDAEEVEDHCFNEGYYKGLRDAYKLLNGSL